MVERKVRSQVLIPLTLTFIILAASFVYTNYRTRMEHYERGMEQRYLRVQHVLNSLINDRIRFMTSAIEFVADQKQFQNAMRSKDREALLKQGAPVLKRLSSLQQLTHFYFYDKNGAIALRVYHPDDRTPSRPRFIMQQAMAQGKTFSGLELGRSGTFTLRVVYPWKINGELIGYIELGQEFDHILEELKVVTLIDFAVLINKKYFDRASWEEGMKLLGRSYSWNLLPDWVLSDQTIAIPPSMAANLLPVEPEARKYGKRLAFNGRTYRAESFPLKDAAQRTVGEFVALVDSTINLSLFRTVIIQVVSFSMLLCGGLFVYSYRVLGRVDRRLLENKERLREEFEKQAGTNQKLESEVAERRRAENSLVRLNETLEQRVMERTSQLNELNLEIEANSKALESAYKDLQEQQATILQQDRMACIGQLAASVAHDINNPIGFVAGNLEVLKNYWSKLAAFIARQDEALGSSASPELAGRVAEQRRALKVDYILEEFDAVLDESLEGAERVSRIVLNLKGFSRQDDKEARLADIHDCLESTLNIVMNELRYKADIKKEYGNIPQLLCYPQQLNQVFMNLLINASQAIERWGEITIRTWSDNENVFVAIADTGCGIGKENLHKLFEPFFSTKEAGVGTGLGLPIVREIIKKHRGEIMVESAPGEGSVFTVRLPLGVSPQEAGRG